MTVIPRKEEKRRNVVANMAKNWTIDTNNKEIRLIKRPWYIRFWHLITLKRYAVRELYIYVYDYFHAPDRIQQLMPIAFPMDHDNIKKPKDVPYNFALKGGWEIPVEFSRKLIKGPLISEDGSTLIVSTDSFGNILFRFLKRLITWLTIPGGLYGTWQAIDTIFK